jgi:hypothetical protein
MASSITDRSDFLNCPVMFLVVRLSLFHLCEEIVAAYVTLSHDYNLYHDSRQNRCIVFIIVLAPSPVQLSASTERLVVFDHLNPVFRYDPDSYLYP